MPGRAERFAAGATAIRPDFSALAHWPAWIALDEPAQLRVGAVAALLASREALADEIDGARLRAYADRVGAETLEAIVTANGGGGAPPEPEDLHAVAASLLAASLDDHAARLVGVAPGYDAATADLVRQAEWLCEGRKP